MKRLVAIASLLMTFASHAESLPIEATQQYCLENAASTLAMQRCYGAASQAWDHEMNHQYAQLAAALNNEQRSKLRIAQRAWLTYRDSWLEASKARLNERGTLASVEVSAQHVNLVKNQALALASLAAAGCANPDGC